MDLSHINTRPDVIGSFEKKGLFEVLNNATVVIMAAGKPRNSPNMPRQDLFQTNADIVFQLMKAVAVYSPNAFIVVVTNPLNSIVPLISEYMMKACIYDPRKIFGVTSLDQVRAAKFIALMNNTAPSCQYVPVVGGNDGLTMVPLFSQSNPPFMQTNESVLNCMLMEIREAGRKVIQKKVGSGSGTLTAAYATARFIHSLLRGLECEYVVECAYVRSDITASPFFASHIVVGKYGLEEIQELGCITPREDCMIKEAVEHLKKNILEAVKYIAAHEKNIPVQIRKK